MAQRKKKNKQIPSQSKLGQLKAQLEEAKNNSNESRMRERELQQLIQKEKTSKCNQATSSIN